MKERATTTKMTYIQMPPLGRKSFAVSAGYPVWNDRGLVLGKRVCGITNRRPLFTWFEMPAPVEVHKNQYLLNPKLLIAISIIMQILFAGLKSAANTHIIQIKHINLHIINSKPGVVIKDEHNLYYF